MYWLKELLCSVEYIELELTPLTKNLVVADESRTENTIAFFIKEIGIQQTLKEIGATEEMLSKIAEFAVPGGEYKHVDNNEILEILKKCF